MAGRGSRNGVIGENHPVSGVRALLLPRSLAVVGASPRFADVIATTLAGGIPVWGVNPRYDEVLGLPCYPHTADLPEPPETAFLLVGHERVEEAFEDAASAGVRAFVVPGVGAESGVAGGPVTERLAARARELDAALLGPNCMGTIAIDGPAAWNGKVDESVSAGRVSVVCQSGSIADAFLSLGGRVGFRAVVSSGAEAVTDTADLIDFFADDEETGVVGLFLETVRRPEAFTAALARCAEAEKPVVCLKVGRSEAAARAVLTHTGALVGSGRAFSAALRRHGAIEVDDFHELVETLELLGRGRRPAGTRVGAISESGGECALLADQAEAAGIPFEPLQADLAARLRDRFPNFHTPGNPLDAWAVDDVEVVYPASFELMAQSGDFDVLLALIDLSQFRDSSSQVWCELLVRALADAVAGTDVLGAFTSVHSSDPPRELQMLAAEVGLPLLRGPRETMLALARAARRPPAVASTDGPGMPALGDLLAADGALPEHESALVLERLGVPFAPRLRAADPAEAERAAAELGPPVVVKLDGVEHKSRAGGVVLDVATPEAAADAARRLGGSVLVAKQLDGGAEAFCGMKRDPQFGPVLAVGLGGTDVERLDRAALSVAPLDLEAARELARDAGLSQGVETIASTIVALGRLAIAHPEVAEIDVNPLIASGEHAVAVDALIVVTRDAI